MRIVFDLSALHGEHLHRVRDSALPSLVRKGYAQVFHTPVFIEECLLGARSERYQGRWADVLKWAVAIPPAGYFLDKAAIWREELVLGRGRYARHVYSSRATRRHSSHVEFEAMLAAVAERRELSAELAGAAAELARDDEKRRAQRHTFQQIRESVAGQARRAGATAALRDVPFWSVLKRDRRTWDFHLADLLGATHADRARALLATGRDRYPFYASFVDGLCFAGYYAACRPQEKIDPNAQADFEQLCYLQWADVFVSNDTKFMKAAFDALWTPKGRRLMTTEEFLEMVGRMA